MNPEAGQNEAEHLSYIVKMAAISTTKQRDDTFWRENEGASLVWSNPDASDDVMIDNALLKPNFHLLLAIAVRFGLDRLEQRWLLLNSDPASSELPGESRKIQMATPTVERCLHVMRKVANS